MLLWKVTFYGSGGPDCSQALYLLDLGPIDEVLARATRILYSPSWVITGITESSIEELQASITA